MKFTYTPLHLLYYFIGGAIGAFFRYSMSKLITLILNNKKNNAPFPHHTLAVNILACFLIGLLGGQFKGGSPLTGHIFHIVLLFGFLGSFSTFSTYIADTFEHYKNKRYGYVTLYTLATFILSLGAVLLGKLIAGDL